MYFHHYVMYVGRLSLISRGPIPGLYCLAPMFRYSGTWPRGTLCIFMGCCYRVCGRVHHPLSVEHFSFCPWYSENRKGSSC
jgi:hypothetical protein